MNTFYRDVSLIGAAALISISASYFTGRNPLTALLFLTIPVGFGITSYLSHDGFNRASMSALIALPFALLGPKMVMAALTVSLGNILVSVFSGGERFRDYYGATKLPLLLVGVIVGLGAFALVQSDPGIQSEIRDTASEQFAGMANDAVQDMDVLESRREQQLQLVRTISSRSVDSTANYVMQDLQDQASSEGLIRLTQSFNDARNEIPGRMVNQTNQSLQETEVNLSESLEQMFREQVTPDRMIAVIPLAMLGALIFQPIVGLITAIVATTAGRLEPKDPDRNGVNDDLDDPDLFD